MGSIVRYVICIFEGTCTEIGFRGEDGLSVV